MNGEIRRSDEVSHDELTKMFRDNMEMTRNKLSLDLDFQKEILQRITRVETSLEHLTNTIEKFIKSNEDSIKEFDHRLTSTETNLDRRISRLEKGFSEAEGAIKTIKWVAGALITIVMSLIGIILKYVR